MTSSTARISLWHTCCFAPDGRWCFLWHLPGCLDMCKVLISFFPACYDVQTSQQVSQKASPVGRCKVTGVSKVDASGWGCHRCLFFFPPPLPPLEKQPNSSFFLFWNGEGERERRGNCSRSDRHFELSNKMKKKKKKFKNCNSKIVEEEMELVEKTFCHASNSRLFCSLHSTKCNRHWNKLLSFFKNRYSQTFMTSPWSWRKILKEKLCRKENVKTSMLCPFFVKKNILEKP